MAFNAKNLQYNKQEPNFLRKLKGEFGGLDGRHNVQIARPKKDRLKTGDDDEDDPVIIDEQGERIEKAEFERRVKGGDEAVKPAAEEEVDDARAKAGEGGTQADRQKVTEIGSSANAKKRKVGRIVGAEEDDAGNRSGKSLEQRGKPSKEKTDKAAPAKDETAAPKKKAKKIKLSFDE